MLILILPLVTIFAIIYKIDTLYIFTSALAILYSIYNLWTIMKIFMYGNTDHARIVLDIYEIPNMNNNEVIINQNQDKYDVHDHHIQQSVKTSFNNLLNWFKHNKVSDPEKTINQIKEYLFSKKYNEIWTKKEKIYSSIRSIEKINGYISSVNMREVNILDMVWQRINDTINSSKKQELIDSLLDQLSDSSVKLDTPYCLIGRFTRIMQSLELLDKENIVTIKSNFILHRELQGKFPILIKEYFIDKQDQEKLYNNGCDKAAKELSLYINSKIKEEYPQLKDDEKSQDIINEYLQELM